jgi:ABC-type transport system involved in multi-copper enzyme maturation permease subunit
MHLSPEHFWTYFQWLFEQGGLLNGFLLAVALTVLGLIVGFLVCMLRYGPSEGFLQLAKTIREFFIVDIPKTSFQRIYAIAKLAVKESIRKKVLVVVGLFVIGLMFAGWYLDPRADNPAQLYVSFVLWVTNCGILVLGLFVSCFSFPADIKSRTIYTIVTKPVRPTEIFLGRVLGFVAIGTFVLVILGVMSYQFVIRGVAHSHEVTETSADGLSGKTAYNSNRFHAHTFSPNEEGELMTNFIKGHVHRVEKDGEKYVVGPTEGDLEARVPIYGMMKFTGRDGEEGEGKGLNVGYMSEYQRYIEGDSLSSAVWRFNGINKSDFEDFVRFDMTLSAFRTYKGDIVTPVGGIVIFRSSDRNVESEHIPFKVKEFQIDQKKVPTSLKGNRGGKPADLDFFKDIAPDGKFEVVVRCTDRNQYLGMAAGDLYLRAKTLSFRWNFFKGFVSIWLQLVVVICFGVMFSTFLSGQIAIVATISVLVLGLFGSFIDHLVTEAIKREAGSGGGGPIESLIRIPMQSGSGVQFDIGNKAVETTIQSVDLNALFFVKILKAGSPNFNELSTTDFIAYGVNLSEHLLAKHFTICFGYLLMTGIISYFFLKTREMAA